MNDALIHRGDLQPWKVGLLALFTAGGGGYYWMGQKQKAYATWAIVLIGGLCTFGMTNVFAFVTAYDAYLLAQRLELGEGIAVNQNALSLLDMIFR